MAKQPSTRGHSKRKRRQHDADAKKKTGVMTGMRRGFKTAATSVTAGQDSKSKKSQLLSTVIIVILVAAVAAVLFYR